MAYPKCIALRWPVGPDYDEEGVKYNEYKAIFTIEDLKMIEGDLPKRVVSLVLEWAFAHREELVEDWNLAVENKPLKNIEPLV